MVTPSPQVEDEESSSMLRHKDKGLSISFLGVFFPLLSSSLIYMTSELFNDFLRLPSSDANSIPYIDAQFAFDLFMLVAVQIMYISFLVCKYKTNFVMNIMTGDKLSSISFAKIDINY